VSVADKRETSVAHPTCHVPSRHVPRGRLNVASLVVKEEVWFELTQKLAFC
jgi:hypothetical protein